MYDTNTLDPNFSGSYTAGRLVAIQNAQFTPGNGGTFSSIQLVEMYGYTQAGQVSGKRLQLNEQLPSGGALLARNLDGIYGYDTEGKTQSLLYPTTYVSNGPGPLVTTPGPNYTYYYDAMLRASEMKDSQGHDVINSVTYDAANRLLGFSYMQNGNPVGQVRILLRIDHSFSFETDH